MGVIAHFPFLQTLTDRDRRWPRIAVMAAAAPVAVAFAMGDRSRAVLDDLRTWLAHHNAAIMTVLLLVIGVKLIGDAISGFAA